MPGEAPRPTPPSASSEIRVIGARRALFRDTYHRFLRAPWWAALLVIVASFLLLNAGFALLYLVTGGIANARAGSFADAFYFSVQTMGTIGYGAKRTPALSRSWTALHPILPGSMLHGQTPASIKASEVELLVTLFGIDDTSFQPVHARHRYTDDQIIWGARHADILHEDENGQLVLDLGKFHELMPTTPTAEFPYPEGASLEAAAPSFSLKT